MAGLLSGLLGAAAEKVSRAPPTPAFSLPRLQQLYGRLSLFRESDLEKPGGGEQVVEIVRQITEALVWGEQNDSSLFDFFCEKSILADFIRVLSLAQAPKTVKVQLLQTLSMLVQNIRRETSLYYILSANYVNRLIELPLDFSNEEILAYYITLLKSLAMRLNDETVKFFFVQHPDQPEPRFPLYIEATKLSGHKDQMVRATVRTITLQVYPIKYEPMRRFVLRHASESYFEGLAYHLIELWYRLDAAVRGGSEDADQKAQYENDLQQDLLIYLSDVFELQMADINEVLADRLLNAAMLPVLLASVGGPEDAGASGATQRPSRGAVGLGRSPGAPPRLLAPSVALFIARQVFDTFRCPALLEPLAAALLQPAVPAALALSLPRHLCGAARTPGGDEYVNPLRGTFLGFLGDPGAPGEACAFAAAVLHSCARNRQALPLAFLQSSGVLPGSRRRGDQHLAQAEGDADGGEVLDVLLGALQQYERLPPRALQALARLVLDLSMDPAVRQRDRSRAAVLGTVHKVLKAAGRELGPIVQESLASDGGDGPLFDSLVEDWPLQRAPLAAMTEVCGSASALLQSQAPPRQAQRPARLAKSFLLLRRLFIDLVNNMPQVPREPSASSVESPPWVSRPEEPSPLQVDQEKLGSYHEGLSFEVGSQERIVCSLGGGRATRYLLLHDYWLLLVQPDIANPGWAVVTTAWPVQLVQCAMDRSEPRALQLGMQARHHGAGHALEDRPSGSAGGFLSLALHFDDVRRCHAASSHLQRCRKNVRSELLRRVVTFVEACCSQPPPR